MSNGEMSKDTAITFINDGLVYPPGWSLTAHDLTARFENTIKVVVSYPACQTNRDQAPEQYPTVIQANAEFPLVVDFHDVYGLVRRLIEEVFARIHLHEDREMIRVKPTFWAPFHPHKIDGMKAWGDVAGDVRFGTA